MERFPAWLRWTALLPGALVAGTLAWGLVCYLNYWNGVDEFVMLDRCSSYAVFGAAFVYFGVEVAPSNRRVVGIVLPIFLAIASIGPVAALESLGKATSLQWAEMMALTGGAILVARYLAKREKNNDLKEAAALTQQFVPSRDKDADARVLFTLLKGALEIKECAYLASFTTGLVEVAGDKSANRIVPAIAHRAPTLSKAQTLEIYNLFVGDEAFSYSGDGESLENPIVIQAANHKAGVRGEYSILENRHGGRGKDWNVLFQETENSSNRRFDVISIEKTNGEKIKVYFDITDFFGKGISIPVTTQ